MKSFCIWKPESGAKCRRMFAFIACLLSMNLIQAETIQVYIGTYTNAKSKGIYVFDFDTSSGKVTSDVRLAAESVNPSFLALHPSKPFLYAVNETGDYQGEKTGAVSAFRITDQHGALDLINQQASRGAAPCHIQIDSTGGSALVANYTSGTVSVLPVEESGGLGTTADVVEHLGSSANPQRQEAAHAHCINLDAANRYAVAADLGVDKVFIYPFDAKNKRFNIYKATSVSVKAGSGPRHFAFHPNQPYGYVINELSNTVVAFNYDSNQGKLDEMQTISTLPDEFKGVSYTAEVFMHPSGKFLYGSNRGHHSIAAFSVNQETGKLKLIETESTQGETPRGFGIDPTGKYLLAANQGTDSVVVFKIDENTGALNPNGVRVDVPTPVCVIFR